MMKDMAKGIGIGLTAGVVGIFAAIIGIFAIFFFCIFGALLGAFTGWFVSIAPIIGELVRMGFVEIGVKEPNLVAIGAMLGFVAGFFKGGSSHGKCC